MNNLNILKYGYTKNLIQNIRQFFRNIKYAYQRITKGYCDADLWSLDCYYAELFYETLNELADIVHGWPQSDKFPDYEDWQEYIREMAKHFRNCQDEYEPKDEILKDIVNRADRLFDELLKYREEEFLYLRMQDEESLQKEQELLNNWLEEEKASQLYREQEKNKAFDMLKEVFFSLWD